MCCYLQGSASNIFYSVCLLLPELSWYFNVRICCNNYNNYNYYVIIISLLLPQLSWYLDVIKFIVHNYNNDNYYVIIIRTVLVINPAVECL